MTDTITLTRSELVAVHREWETRRRLFPSTFSDPESQDLDENVDRSVAFFLRLLEEHRATTWDFAAPSEPGDGRSIAEAISVDFCAARAADALEKGSLDLAAHWTDLARVFR